MNFVDLDHAVIINAPAATVWDVFSDVEHWPDWTPSVVRVSYVDGATTLQVGTAVRIKQPRMPKLVWKVTALTSGRSWTWVAKSPGVVTSATHEIDEIDATTCRVRQQIEHRGPLAALVGRLTASRTRRYLEQEAAGLKQRSEARLRAGAAPA